MTFLQKSLQSDLLNYRQNSISSQNETLDFLDKGLSLNDKEGFTPGSMARVHIESVRGFSELGGSGFFDTVSTISTSELVDRKSLSDKLIELEVDDVRIIASSDMGYDVVMPSSAYSQFSAVIRAHEGATSSTSFVPPLSSKPLPSASDIASSYYDSNKRSVSKVGDVASLVESSLVVGLDAETPRGLYDALTAAYRNPLSLKGDAWPVTKQNSCLTKKEKEVLWDLGYRGEGDRKIASKENFFSRDHPVTPSIEVVLVSPHVAKTILPKSFVLVDKPRQENDLPTASPTVDAPSLKLDY
jgi:hypothetical protein